MNHFEIISTVAVLLLLAGAIVTLVFMAISDATRKPEPDWKAIATMFYERMKADGYHRYHCDAMRAYEQAREQDK